MLWYFAFIVTISPIKIFILQTFLKNFWQCFYNWFTDKKYACIHDINSLPTIDIFVTYWLLLQTFFCNC